MNLKRGEGDMQQLSATKNQSGYSMYGMYAP